MSLYLNTLLRRGPRRELGEVVLDRRLLRPAPLAFAWGTRREFSEKFP